MDVYGLLVGSRVVVVRWLLVASVWCAVVPWKLCGCRAGIVVLRLVMLLWFVTAVPLLR